MQKLRVFIGWDSREIEAYEVARFSMARRTSKSVQVSPIKLADLQARGLFWRQPDPLASTEFTYTRFLTPFLAGYQGWALFCDCDFLWLDDVQGIMGFADSSKAVMCVQHDYRPSETTKMDGKLQTVYPRKNWSSLMLFNCDHQEVRNLSPEVVNRESGAFLHRMQWVPDSLIGSIPIEWNWLEGWSERPAVGTPKAIHFTRGGPWFDAWRNVEYADLWLEEQRALLSSGSRPSP